MKSRKPTLLGNGSSSFLFSLVVAAATAPAFAATITWDGGPATTGTDIGTAENWTGDVLPSAATPDTAQWNATPAGPLSLVYSNAAFAGLAGNAGLNLELTAAQTDSVSIDSALNTGSMRINNITIATGAGALTLGNGTDAFNLTLGGGASTQTFTNNSTNPATISSDVVVGLGGGSNHVLNFTGSGNWSVASNLAFASGGQAALYKTGTGTLTLSGGGALKEGPTVHALTGVTAVLKEGTTIINGGTYTNNITTNNGEFVVGGLDTVGTNTNLIVNNASVLNGIDWLSVGKGNGTGATTSNLTLNNTASISSVNMSLGWNNNNTATTPAGTVTLNDSTSLTVSTTSHIAESAGANYSLKLNGASTATLTSNINIAGAANTTALVELNGTSTFKQTGNVTNTQTRLGNADGAVGTLHINGGTATFERDLVFGYAGTGTGRLTLDSGTLNVATATERWLKLNDTVGSKGELTINGGNINLNTNTDIRFSTSAATTGTSFVTLNGGAITGYTGNNNGVFSGASVVDLNQSSNTGTVNNTFNLNGGTLTIGQVITGNDSGTATFNFNGGTLKAAANSANFVDLGGANQTASILAGGAKIDTNGANVTIPQPLVSGVAGDGGLTKLGAGSLALTSGFSNYTGATTVSAGTLSVPSGVFFSWSSGITVNGSGAKLGSSGIVSVPVTLTSGTVDASGAIDYLTIANSASNSLVAGNGAAGQLTLMSLTFQGAASVTAQANGTSMERNFFTSALTTNAAGPITVNATNTTGVWTSGTDYPVIEYSTLTGNLAHFTLGTVPGLNPNQTAQLVNTGSAIAIRITGESLVWTGTQSGDWTTSAVGGSRNWSYQNTGIEFTANSPVIFNDNTSRYNVNLASNVSPSTILFANDMDYVLSSTGNFGITSGTLTKNGFGKLTIGTNNTYTGATTINQGIVEVTGSIATSSTITVVNGAELILNPATATTYGNILAGAGDIRKQGAAALTLSGANTTTGNIYLEAGTLNLNSAGALGTGTGFFEINGGVLDNTSGAALTLTGAKPQRWNTDITFTGTNDLALGTGAVTLGGDGTSRTVNVVAGNLGAGPIASPAYDLVKTGAGALRLSGGVPVIHGTVDIQAGIIGSAEDFYADGLTGPGVFENNTANTKWSFWNIVNDRTTGTLLRDGAGVGRLGIVKRGAGTWTLTNNSNSPTGNLSVDLGKLVLNNTGSYGANGPAGAVITNLTSVVGNTGGGNGVLEINGATVNYNTMSNADALAYRGSLNVGNNGTGAGAVHLNSGSLTTYRQLALGSAAGSYGGFTQTGGTTNVGGFLAIGLGTASGSFVQTGGTYNQTTAPITNGAGAGSNGVMRLTGSAIFNVSGTGDNGLWLGEAGTGRLSVSGNAALNIAVGNNGLQLGRVAAGVGIANLIGGNVTTPAVTKGPGTGTLNFNGGTLTSNTASATFLTGLTGAYVNAGGGTIANGGNAITIGQALLAPTGNGVSAAGLTVSGSGFIDAPIVVITGDGTGATAVAEVNAAGVLTGITMTNPGIGYTTPPVFSLLGGGIGSTSTIGGEATLVPNVSGSMTFTGTATTILSGQNTYTGNTVVSSGTTLAVVSSGGLTFKPGANNVSNKVTGAGLASFDGAFNIDLTGAAVANGNSWTLVDVASKSYSVVTFTIPGFTEVSNVWTKVDGNNTWTFSESTGVLSLAVSGGSGNFASWIGGFGLAPADQAATADPDGDGISNFMEYALGGNPGTRDSSLLPTGIKSGSNFVLSFSRSDIAVSNGDAPLAIEYGTTLGSWTTVAVPATSGTVGGVTFTIANGSPNDSVTASIPTASGTKFFARVKAGN